jgi:hypothetical protein
MVPGTRPWRASETYSAPTQHFGFLPEVIVHTPYSSDAGREPSSLGQSIYRGKFVYFVWHPARLGHISMSMTVQTHTSRHPCVQVQDLQLQSLARRGMRQARPACERCPYLHVRARCAHATVLVQHALSRFKDAYSVFRFATKEVGARVAHGWGWAAR